MTWFTQTPKIIIAIFTLVVVLGLALTALRFVRAQTTPSAQLLLSPETVSTRPADTFSVYVGMTTTDPVFGVDTILLFDSTLLDVVSVSLGSTELKTLAPGTDNIIDLTRAVTIGTDPTQSTLEFGSIAYDQTTEATTSGILGTVDPDTNPIATVVFKARKGGTGTISPKFDNPGVTTDSNAVAISQGASIDILTAPTAQIAVTITACYDFNASGEVDIQDLMLVATHWNTKTGDANYDGLYDLDSDGDIDIADIQLAANSWGTACSGGAL